MAESLLLKGAYFLVDEFPKGILSCKVLKGVELGKPKTFLAQHELVARIIADLKADEYRHRLRCGSIKY